jgi:Protein of unknown function (DUF3995)
MGVNPAFLAYPLILVLLSLAALHAYWGMGGFWPGSDESSLVEHVVGRTSEMKAPPFMACMLVAACLAAVAGLVVVKVNNVSLPALLAWIPQVGLFGAAAVFLLRGMAAYVPKVFDYAVGTPFFRLNLIFYSPLCIAIGASIVALNLMRA